MSSLSISKDALVELGLHEIAPGVWKKKPQLTVVKNAKKVPAGLQAIMNVLDAAAIPYVREHQFHPLRKWKADVAILSLCVLVEYEGIFSEKSRHTGVKGYTEDACKYNAAQLLGWKVLRYTAKNYKNFINDLKQLI